ncbi:MAG: hypothetical protein HFH69_12625 [Lachnospiraceae bacterium]|nr:hypothetical protein [Lachnospiraceae bacterium]
MSERIKEEIKRLERKMEWKQEELAKAVERFRESAVTYNACDIETFVPGMVGDIAKLRATISEVEEQKSMLEYLLNQQ